MCYFPLFKQDLHILVQLHFFNYTTAVRTFELFILIEGGWQQFTALSKSMILLGHYNEGCRFFKYIIGLFA